VEEPAIKSVKLYSKCIFYPYKNRRLKPIEIVLRMRVRGEGK
jgi:hypothetical protein